MPEPTRGQRRVALFVREDLPKPVRTRLSELSTALDHLVAEDSIDSYTTESWSKRASTAAVDPAQRSRYTSFSEWARSANVRLSPGFGTRRCYSTRTGEPEDQLVFPAVALAVYDGGRLEAVYPHVGQEPRSIQDGLAKLAEADPQLSGTLESSAAD